MSEKVIHEPSTYRQLSEPFDNVEAWHAACERFYEGLRKLREECGLADIVVVVASPVICEGQPTELFTLQTCGDQLKQEAMTAWAFGRSQEARETIIAKLLAKSPGRKKKDSLFD